jgi:hypothetical protein
MKRIRIAFISFDTLLKQYEIPAFRAAVIEKVGMENILFHNHLNKGYLYRYPLIQYKQIGNKPALYCIEQGVDEIHKFFQQKDWNLKLSGRWLDMKINKLLLNSYNMQVWDSLWDYNIYNWLALNQENYNKYLAIESLTERIYMLESILKANILSLAKGIEWNIEKEIKMHIRHLNEGRKVKHKGVYVEAFNVDFKTNVFLPNFIGLGKGVSRGFGIVKRIKNEKPSIK